MSELKPVTFKVDSKSTLQQILFYCSKDLPVFITYKEYNTRKKQKANNKRSRKISSKSFDKFTRHSAIYCQGYTFRPSTVFLVETSRPTNDFFRESCDIENRLTKLYNTTYIKDIEVTLNLVDFDIFTKLADDEITDERSRDLFLQVFYRNNNITKKDLGRGGHYRMSSRL